MTLYRVHSVVGDDSADYISLATDREARLRVGPAGESLCRGQYVLWEF